MTDSYGVESLNGLTRETNVRLGQEAAGNLPLRLVRRRIGPGIEQDVRVNDE